ncbi:DUF2974 domain-containing protein [Streptococcus suis]|nr:DUF2974 domain-containing protein [Streptococcus suis]
MTDIKLPEQPTAADYEKVIHVTLLYRGFTGFNEIVDKPVDVLADWVVNDIPMAIRTTVPDTIPTRASVQLRKAADFTNDSLEKYPNALFDFYGHSLGSMNAQYALASIDEKNLDRVSGAFIYNGPNTYRVLNEEQRQKVDYLHSLIYNYVDSKDLIGMGYSQPDGAVGQVFV